MSCKPDISIVIPVLNEAANLGACLEALQSLKNRCEIIVADGGSSDLSMVVAASLADKIVCAPRGRAKQMNAGAAVTQGDILLFLHADTFLPQQAPELIRQGIASDHCWGRFNVHLDGKHPLLRIVALLMNWRSRLTGIATGDQGIFMTREAFDQIGGFPEIALMEDIAVSKKLKQIGKPYCSDEKIITSARRWEQNGIIGTILLMWRLRLRYFFGADPQQLAQAYYRGQ